MKKKKTSIGIVGGGINGLSIAWESAKRGADVTLFERNKIMEKTSRASTKLLHGGLRYLEHLEFNLVKESLHERNWWLNNVPSLTNKIELHLPIFSNSSRSRLKYKLGLWLYDKLSGSKNIKNHKWISKANFIKKNEELKSEKLKGGFVFYDGQMYDYELGCWVADKSKEEGSKIYENCEVKNLSVNGNLGVINNGNLKKYSFDFIINASGSFTEKILINNNIKSHYSIDHIRGSHILINRKISHGYFLEFPNEKRIFFVLPYKNKTLIGTTEVPQKLSSSVKCSLEEKKYLINGFNHYFSNQISTKDIVGEFSGLRPLIKSKSNFSKSSREYAIQIDKKLISIYGGKWTTCRSLAINVCNKIDL